MSSSPTHADSSASGTTGVSLPVIDDRRTIRPSRMGRRRAIVLGLVQLAIIIHVIQWLVTGSTVSPVEPSESMDFVKEGKVNAGLVFFALALLSTLIFGRWFCGWGCHLVMLQDLCGWMMKKLGVRPKPFRSRILIWVPFVLAMYMFVWPAVFRWGVLPLDTQLANSMGASHWVVESYRFVLAVFGVDLPTTLPGWHLDTSHLVKRDFWATFAGVAIAIPFLGICGFACVYFLGAKGFCTYGCPYGGFFAPLDELAPGRIRVTDACEHCGHCTAVCTSNVRVHEEVREYGMVVDPGCMKCFDCVSVCPNDALYFGFGRPAINKPEPKNAAPKRKYDLTKREEYAMLLVLVVSFMSLRGIYGAVPMLMAIGAAGCVTFLTWKLWRLLRDPSVSFHRKRLKYKGTLGRSGVVFVFLAGLVVLFTIHSAFLKGTLWAADYHDRQVRVPLAAVYGQPREPIDAETRASAEAALRWYGRGSSLNDGGIALFGLQQPEIDNRRAWLLSVLGDLDGAQTLLEGSMASHGRSDGYIASLMTINTAQGRFDDAIAMARDLMLEDESVATTMNQMIAMLGSAGRLADARTIVAERVERFPDDVVTLERLALIDLDLERPADAERSLREAMRLEPERLSLHSSLARTLAIQGRYGEAEQVLRAALEDAPNEPSLRMAMAGLMQLMGREDEARTWWDGP